MSMARTSSVSALQTLLSHLEDVRPSGRGYRSRCPSCGGKSRKLSVAETSDGRVLLHCFAMCSAVEVLDAIGLTLADLFPNHLASAGPLARQFRREGQWGAALDILVFESTIVLIAGRQLAAGEPLNAEDGHRLAKALDRIQGARETLRGH